jgi:hypothetical protein
MDMARKGTKAIKQDPAQLDNEDCASDVIAALLPQADLSTQLRIAAMANSSTETLVRLAVQSSTLVRRRLLQREDLDAAVTEAIFKGPDGTNPQLVVAAAASTSTPVAVLEQFTQIGSRSVDLLLSMNPNSSAEVLDAVFEASLTITSGPTSPFANTHLEAVTVALASHPNTSDETRVQLSGSDLEAVREAVFVYLAEGPVHQLGSLGK